MKLTEKKKKEILKIYDTWMHSYLHGDVAAYDSFLHDDYHFIGSAKNEEFLNRKDTTKFFEDTGDQFAGKTEIRDETKTIEQFGELIFMTHIFDGWFLNENDWTFYARFRFTSVLKNTKHGWRFIYQHFSIPDSKTGEGETIGYDKINDENQELREAITRRTFELEAKNRELKIEGALGRIRAQATAMKASTELLDIVVTMRNEFIKLGHEAHYFWHMMWLPNTYEKAMTSGDGTRIGFVMTLPRHIHGEIPLLANWEQSKDATVVYAMNTEDAINYVDKMVALGDFQNIDPQAPSHDDIRHIGGLTFIMARTTHGEIGYSLPGVVKNPPKEDLHILERFASAFDLAHRRFLDLQKAEQQAREVQIELALEKVRSRTMAMQKSEELADVATVLFQQVKALGIEQWTCGFNIWETGDTEFTFYPGGPDGELLPSCKVPLLEHPIFRQFDASRRRGDELFIYEKEGDVQKDHYSYMHSLPGMGDMLQNMLDQGMEFPDYQIDHVANFAYGNIVFITYEPFPEMHDVFKRFAKVFEQTYTRFLDLQKAEAQAREAQIEAALERVRSRSMAMHKSSELRDVVNTLHIELRNLDVNFNAACIQLLKGESEDLYVWIGTADGLYKNLIHWPDSDLRMKKVMHKARLKKTYFEISLTKAETKEFFEEYFRLEGVPKERKTIMSSLEVMKAMGHYQADTGVFLIRYTEGSFTEDEKIITERFSKAFEQTYTRFLDLQKAEEQARDAQIETALERIRSRSMAMHNTSELSEVILILFKQFELLGLAVDACFIDIFDNVNAGFNAYISTGTAIYPTQAFLPYMDHPIHQLNKDARQGKIDFFTFDEDKDSKDRYFKHFYANAKGIEVPQERRKLIAKGVGMTGSVAFGKHSGVHIFNYRGINYTSEENDILRRVNIVFQQTYTRFLDLQKAEAREREAVKQASLDRVRAEIASMRHATDLKRITPLVWSELKALGVPFFRCGVMLVNEDTKILDFYLSNPKGEALAALHLDFESSDIARNGLKYWRNKEVYIEHWDQNQFIEFMKQLMSQGHIADATTYQGGEQAPTTLTLQFVPFTQGMVYVGSEEELSKDELDLVEALGKSLAVAYARYEDFTKLDIAKAEADKALLDLKSVQEQMIQQEKLASLGQLTAGIAHEIKNPLNFVNNFSDLSGELLDEVFEELEHISDSDSKKEIIAILNDVKSNIAKVSEHGTRADGIVTSMLQHSRASGSKREPKPFNPLVKEFVNLSFHGMRAGKSPINVKIDLQLDPKVGDVTLISEDFSRVILNLSNNAFDAMRDKLYHNNKPVEYMPELTVKTELDTNMVILSIGDNGPGISKDIQDKILQPFFTTKKGTEGTGLGLSITNDIIKAHRGELSLKSAEGKGTIFSIKIPIQ